VRLTRGDYVTCHVQRCSVCGASYLGKHAYGPLTVRVDGAGHLEPIAIDQVAIGGGDGQDDRVGVLDKVQAHTADLVFNVFGLVSCGHGTVVEVVLGVVEGIVPGEGESRC